MTECWRLVYQYFCQEQYIYEQSNITQNQKKISNSIFCNGGPGTILHTVQMARLFSDSKTFVDSRLKRKPEEIEAAFQDMMKSFQPNDKAEILKFVHENFSFDFASSLIPCNLEDWNGNPTFVDRIRDKRLKQFALSLHERWKLLCCRIHENVGQFPDHYSLIYLPNRFIVPGGRFREIYYWDSYWIIRGLLVSSLHCTVRDMLLNFIHLLKQFGFIPNGGRMYYINRSQPPMFISMVREYVDASGDTQFVRENIKYLEMEFEYWRRHHMIKVILKNGKTYNMARYCCQHPGPRPESYYEDYHLASDITRNNEEKQNIYMDLKTAAESGWDFSSRWYIDRSGSNHGYLKDTKIRRIIPVDLNALLVHNAQQLAYFNSKILHDHYSALNYIDFSNNLSKAITDVLWNDKEGIWYDFDLLKGRARRYFYPSCLVPLWTRNVSDFEQVQEDSFVDLVPLVSIKQCRAVVKYLQNNDLITLQPGGFPTSLINSGQQWDFPNCWPPLEHFVIMGLEKTGLKSAKALALVLAQKRVHGCWRIYKNDSHMFEKYNCTRTAEPGNGGEYEVQLGFGWTNGVVLDLIDYYGSQLSLDTLELKENLTDKCVS